MKRLVLGISVFLLLAAPCFADCILKKSASQEISIGPFVDSMDGDTEKTGLTINASDIRLKKGSADWVAKNSGGATHEEHGNYRITLDATDTNTVGILEIVVHVSTALAVFKTCEVVETAVYTAFYDVSAPGYVNGAIVTVGTNNDKTGYALSAPGIAAILNTAVESTGLTFVQGLRMIFAVEGGKSSGSGTSTITFRDIGDTKDVISCNVSGGNRISCTRNLN